MCVQQLWCICHAPYWSLALTVNLSILCNFWTLGIYLGNIFAKFQFIRSNTFQVRWSVALISRLSSMSEVILRWSSSGQNQLREMMKLWITKNQVWNFQQRNTEIDWLWIFKLLLVQLQLCDANRAMLSPSLQIVWPSSHQSSIIVHFLPELWVPWWPLLLISWTANLTTRQLPWKSCVHNLLHVVLSRIISPPLFTDRQLPSSEVCLHSFIAFFVPSKTWWPLLSWPQNGEAAELHLPNFNVLQDFQLQVTGVYEEDSETDGRNTQFIYLCGHDNHTCEAHCSTPQCYRSAHVCRRSSILIMSVFISRPPV